MTEVNHPGSWRNRKKKKEQGSSRKTKIKGQKWVTIKGECNYRFSVPFKHQSSTCPVQSSSTAQVIGPNGAFNKSREETDEKWHHPSSVLLTVWQQRWVGQQKGVHLGSNRRNHRSGKRLEISIFVFQKWRRWDNRENLSKKKGFVDFDDNYSSRRPFLQGLFSFLIFCSCSRVESPSSFWKCPWDRWLVRGPSPAGGRSVL